jgi:hypothetical protein
LLHGFDATKGEAVRALGAEGEEHALLVELRVTGSLEPMWSVLDSEGESHGFMARDREALGMLRVGGHVDQHLGWGRGSILTRLTESGDGVGGVLAEATRQARAGLNVDRLDKLSAAAQKVEALGKHLGFAATHSLVPHLDASSLSVAAGALSLHDGKVPTRRAGLGTRRLLAVAMQREVAAQSGLTIVDEFEHGLEPHRIRRLLRVLRGRPPEPQSTGAGGQLILTTHSATVISELEAAEVAVTRRTADGMVMVQSLPAPVSYVLSRTPEALLARKVVVTEGATEEGLCLALDEAWTKAVGPSFAYLGVAVVDGGGGTQPAEIACHLTTLGFDAVLLIDSDAKAKAAKAAKAKVLAWPGGVSTEQRLATDLPLTAVKQMAVMATTSAKKGARSVRDAIADKLHVGREALALDAPETWVDAVDAGEFRTALGTIAKQEKHAWFKSREQGAFLGGLITEHWTEIEGTPTHAVIGELRSYLHG